MYGAVYGLRTVDRRSDDGATRISKINSLPTNDDLIEIVRNGELLLFIFEKPRVFLFNTRTHIECVDSAKFQTATRFSCKQKSEMKK
jgi:hypothetical protein